MSDSGLPPVRRIVTRHNDDGRARIGSDEKFPTQLIPSGDAAFALIWTTQTVPADNNDETDGRDRDAGLTINHGSVIRIVDMMPGGSSPMHRTNSIDYGIVLSGALELELEDGDKTRLGPGDIVVQRGTMHLWRNLSDTEPCRIAFVLIEAPAYQQHGAPLPETKP